MLQCSSPTQLASTETSPCANHSAKLFMSSQLILTYEVGPIVILGLQIHCKYLLRFIVKPDSQNSEEVRHSPSSR